MKHIALLHDNSCGIKCALLTAHRVSKTARHKCSSSSINGQSLTAGQHGTTNITTYSIPGCLLRLHSQRLIRIIAGLRRTGLSNCGATDQRVALVHSRGFICFMLLKVNRWYDWNKEQLNYATEPHRLTSK